MGTHTCALSIQPHSLQLIQKRLSVENTKSKFQNTKYKIKILWWASNVNISLGNIPLSRKYLLVRCIYYRLEVKRLLMCVMWHTFSCILYFVIWILDFRRTTFFELAVYEINIQNHKIHSLDPVDISGLHYNQTTDSLLRQESDTFSSCKNR